MNAARYLKMLQDCVWPVISQWKNIAAFHFMQDGAPPHFANAVRTWLHDHFMQDGAPPHFANAVRTWLHDHFPGQWIGRRGVHEWPPRSPDLTPFDFFCGVDQETS
jgi:hypothetical protein